jgi:hypothetical protein
LVSPEEAGIGAAPARVANAASDRSRPGCDQLIRIWGGADRPDSRQFHQLGLNLGHEAGDLAFEVVRFGFEFLDTLRGRPQGTDRGTVLHVPGGAVVQPRAVGDLGIAGSAA